MDNTLTKQENTPLSFMEIQQDLQKSYLATGDYNIVPLENAIAKPAVSEISTDGVMSTVRFFRVEKFVYEKDIKISYKLRSVFTALHSIGATLLMQLKSDGKECGIYFGVKSQSSISSKQGVLKGAFEGNFPGTTFYNEGKPLSNQDVVNLNKSTFDDLKEITAVVGIPSIKDKEDQHFIQGIENLILGMNGKPFSAVFIAEPQPLWKVDLTLDVFEQIFSVLSSAKEFISTSGTNSSSSKGISTSESKSSSTSKSITEGSNESTTTNSSPWFGKKIGNLIFGIGSKSSELTSDIFEWTVRSGAKVLKAGARGAAAALDLAVDRNPKSEDSFYNRSKDLKFQPDINKKNPGSKTVGSSHSESDSQTTSSSSTTSVSKASTQGNSFSEQRTFVNKKVTHFLEQLDGQIKRLDQGRGIGFWNVGAYFISDKEQNSVIAANIYNGIIKGQESNFETSAVRTYTISERQERDGIRHYLERYEIPVLDNGGFLAQAVTTDELTVQINLPHKSVVGLDVVESVPFGNNPQKESHNNIIVGNLYNYDKALPNQIALDYNKFTGHLFITGSTGSGKSNVTYNVLEKLSSRGIKFLVIEPAKGEYKDEFGHRDDVTVYGTNPDYAPLLKINPFSFPANIHIFEHIDRLIEILNACWPMEAAMPNLLKEAIEDAYINKGWILEESRCIEDHKTYPNFRDLLQSLQIVMDRSAFSAEVRSNYEGALVSRVRSLTNGLNQMIFTNRGIADKELFDENVIIDLSRVASIESKSLIMGLTFMKLNEYRIANKTESNSDLKHITILEEAHNLLKRTSTEQNQMSGNLAGKSVEMISNSIAEMRTYGEGFIIADQAPGLLDMSVIRNTNTKICLRLPDYEDRKLVGKAMNLSEEQVNGLADLDTGVAAIYQNNWQEAILCKFVKFESKGTKFEYSPDKKNTIQKAIRLINQMANNPALSTVKHHDNIRKSINLDFLQKQFSRIDSNVSVNLKTIEMLKLIMKTCGTSIEDAKIILSYLSTVFLGISKNKK